MLSSNPGCANLGKVKVLVVLEICCGLLSFETTSNLIKKNYKLFSLSWDSSDVENDFKNQLLVSLTDFLWVN